MTTDGPPSSLPSSHLPVWRITLCASAMCGVQLCYAAQVNRGTAELLTLGVPSRLVSLAWLAGPLSGLLIQPLIGRASDRCVSPLGRRRPFLLAGAILTSFALLLFSSARTHLPAGAPALTAAIVAFFLLDFCIQAVQAPLRALVTDVVPRPQRALANSMLGVFTGLGLLLAGLLTSQNLPHLMPVFQTDVQALFSVAAVVLVLTVSVCVLATVEEPSRPPTRYAALPHLADSFAFDDAASDTSCDDDDDGVARGVDTSERGRREREEKEHRQQQHQRRRAPSVALRGVPRPFWAVFAVQLCTWCGFFTLFVYANAWVGTNVYLGDGSAAEGTQERALFEAGVRLGGQGNAVMACVTLLYSLLLPWLLRRFGTTRVYAFSQAVEAGCLLSAPWIRGRKGQSGPAGWVRAAVVGDIGMFGVVWATTMGVPWTLVGNALEGDGWYARRVGLFQTVFNASQSFPQLVVAVVAPAVLGVAGGDVAWVMALGGAVAVVGGVLVVWWGVGGDGDGVGSVSGVEGRKKQVRGVGPGAADVEGKAEGQHSVRLRSEEDESGDVEF